MKYSVRISSAAPFNPSEFFDSLGAEVCRKNIVQQSDSLHHSFYRPGVSTTVFYVAEYPEGHYDLVMSGLASYEDYCFFPYLLDCLSQHLNHTPYTEQGLSAFQLYDEEWRSEAIAEAIAVVKTVLSVGVKYYIPCPLEDFPYLMVEQMLYYGVTVHSSTPRLYGYIQYLLRRNLLPSDPVCLFGDESLEEYPVIEADVPQHVPIGKVKSWHTDGSETWETFSREDVDALLRVASVYATGNEIIKDNMKTFAKGVVLNDLGTIYQEGIGVEKNAATAAYWYREAIKMGDTTYAPANLGDLYRKGGEGLEPCLSKAFKAYSYSDEPYALYRIGQAYEEGWVGEPDLAKAMIWYRESADKGHHLALARLAGESS